MSIHSSHRPRHRESFPAPPNPGIYRHIAYGFVGITVVIVVAALWLSSVHATVTLTADRERTSVDASVDVARVPGQGQLPGRVVQGVFEKIQEAQVGAGGRQVDTVAVGRVRISNNYSANQALVKTTRLLTADGRLYHIDSTVNVPSQGTVDVDAYADKPGPLYEFSQKTTFTIPGLSSSLQKWIMAESLSPFAGGSKTVKVLTQEDIDAAGKTLEVAILDQAKQTLKAEAADSRFTNAVYLVKRIDAKTSVPVGKEADNFLLSVKLDVTGVFYAKGDMDALIKQRLEERIPEGRDVVSYDPEGVEFSVSRVDATQETATIAARAQMQTKLTDKSPSVDTGAILGLPIDEAETKLEQIDGISSARITVRPSWVSRLPTQKDRITVKVE